MSKIGEIGEKEVETVLVFKKGPCGQQNLSGVNTPDKFCYIILHNTIYNNHLKSLAK